MAAGERKREGEALTGEDEYNEERQGGGREQVEDCNPPHPPKK